MNYGNGDQHLSNTSKILRENVTSNETMRNYVNFTLDQMKEYLLDTHKKENHIGVTIKCCRILLKVLMSKYMKKSNTLRKNKMNMKKKNKKMKKNGRKKRKQMKKKKRKKNKKIKKGKKNQNAKIHKHHQGLYKRIT
jgi:hypothetical protein